MLTSKNTKPLLWKYYKSTSTKVSMYQELSIKKLANSYKRNLVAIPKNFYLEVKILLYIKY